MELFRVLEAGGIDLDRMVADTGYSRNYIRNVRSGSDKVSAKFLRMLSAVYPQYVDQILEELAKL